MNHAVVNHGLYRSVWQTITATLSNLAGSGPIPRLVVGVAGAALGLAAFHWWLRYPGRHQPALTYVITPPGESAWDPAAWMILYRTLFGISSPWWKRLLLGQPWIALEFWSAAGRVAARCWFPARLETVLLTHIRMALPGVEVSRCEAEPELAEPTGRARLHFWREDLYALGAGRADPLRPILGALSVAPQAVMQVVISPDVRWQARAQQRWATLSGQPVPRGPVSGILTELSDIFLGWLIPVAKPAAPSASPLTPMPAPEKAREPGYRAELRLRVAARSKAEAKGLMHTLASAFRSLDGSNGLRPHRVWRGAHFDRALTQRWPPCGRGPILVAEELARLFHVPCPGIPMDTAATRVAPARALPQSGKPLCFADALGGTAVTISQPDCRQHLHILGPTGSGKSTLMVNLALDDIRAGRGVGVVDPKGDLVRALLERIPASEEPRILLIDPSYREQPIGLNLLECDDPDLHEVVSDAIVTIFKKTYERFWGPRTDDTLRAAILTLLRKPDATLCEVPLLLLRPQARLALTEGLDDPVGLEPFWEEYERMPDSQRLQTIGPLLNKLRAFLLRRTVRNMLGQARSTINIPQAVDRHGIVLVSLAKGLLGEETSRLLGSLMVARIWQAALARARQHEDQRADFNLYLDEFQNYLYLPQSLDEVLVEARGHHLSLTLANQHLAQLQPSTREALAANARTRVAFQCGQEDARYLAREFDPGFTERDLRTLQRFQVAVRLCVDGRTESPFTGITRPMPPSQGEGHAERLAAAALGRHGRPRATVEAEIIERLRAKGLLEAARRFAE